MIKKQKNAQILSGIVVVILGIVTLVQSQKIPKSYGAALQPKVFPTVIGWALIVLGIILMAESFWKYKEKNPDVAWPDHRGTVYWVICFAAMALYTALIEPIGFLPTTFVFMVFSIKFFGTKYSWLFSILTSLLTVVIIYFFFIWFLKLPIPMGLLSFLR